MNTPRDLLLAFHLYWDFAWSEWETWEARAPQFSPNELAALMRCSLFPGKNAVGCWQEALEVSAKIPFVRLTPYETAYPSGLRRLARMPPVLYVKGEAFAPMLGTITIVGTRKSSELGERASYQMAFSMGAIGMAIASGLALGVDSVAHQGALDADAQTIAVLGNAMGEIYPRENYILAEKILANRGTIVSEFPPGALLQKYFFPRRNLILASLGAGILVTEAPPKSGAQITAKAALAVGAPVAVLPRNFDEPAGEGATQLIRDGAWPCLNCQEVLEYFNFGNCGQRLLTATGNATLPKIFSLEQFCELYSGPFLHRVRRLQQMLRVGLVREIGANRYQWQSFRPIGPKEQ